MVERCRLVIVDSLIRGIPGVITMIVFPSPPTWILLLTLVWFLSGNHRTIEEWRRKNSLAKTQNKEKGVTSKGQKSPFGLIQYW